MAETAGAFWLLDVVGSYQPQLHNAPFQIWRVEAKHGQGTVSMREDTHRPERVRQEIEYTDFPEGVFEMYYTDRVLMLKGEY